MKKIVAAIGIFDGVHLGHRKIIRAAARAAKRIGGRGAVITFDPHPLKILRSHNPIPSIMSTAHRVRLIRELGADACSVIRFTKKFSSLKPRDFVKKILIDRVKVSELFVGTNFVFGRDNSGDIALLKSLGREHGFKVRVVPMVKAGGKIISSTAIRGLIIKGRLEEASRMLGRPVTIFGTVISGAGRGRLLGYPTANIDPHHEAIPPSGVYAVRVKIGNKKFGGALFIGRRRTFGEREPVIEAHIFDFRSVIYGEDIEVTFVKRLRGVKKFAGHERLVEQIGKDDIAARRMLKMSDK
jgi:riboflavin kinase / FMN adenylyltransferase